MSLPNPSNEAIFSPFEIRVLGTLAEKEATTPDNYPLSLNALSNGCNQLTSREPVMLLSEETVQSVLETLIEKKFVSAVHQAGARVPKYEHRLRIKWLLEADKLAVLTVLMLRGAQTAGEIRSRCARIYDFPTIDALDVTLQFLIDKFPPLVARLSRTNGAKEVRYIHLLEGKASLAQQELVKNEPSSNVLRSRHELEAEVQRLRSELDTLRNEFDTFKSQF